MSNDRINEMRHEWDAAKAIAEYVTSDEIQKAWHIFETHIPESKIVRIMELAYGLRFGKE